MPTTPFIGQIVHVESSRFRGTRAGIVSGLQAGTDAAVECRVSAYPIWDPARDNGPFQSEHFMGVPFFATRDGGVALVEEAKNRHKIREDPHPLVYAFAYPIPA